MNVETQRVDIDSSVRGENVPAAVLLPPNFALRPSCRWSFRYTVAAPPEISC